MERFDLYTHVHKAIRLLWFDAVAAAGRADFGGEADLSAPLAAVRRAIRLTRSHARHEDAEIHPTLHRLAPEVAADLEAEHDRFDGIDREIESCLARLVADHLRHMALEESRANRVLWAHLSDAELSAVEERIVAAIEPAELAEWLDLMLAAGNESERAALLASTDQPSAAREGAVHEGAAS